MFWEKTTFRLLAPKGIELVMWRFCPFVIHASSTRSNARHTHYPCPLSLRELLYEFFYANDVLDSIAIGTAEI